MSDATDYVRKALAGSQVSNEPATEADVDRAVNRVVVLMRRRMVAAEGDEAELRQYAKCWLADHPTANYIRLYSAISEYVYDHIYDGPLADYFSNVRPQGAKALKASKDGYGGHA